MVFVVVAQLRASLRPHAGGRAGGGATEHVAVGAVAGRPARADGGGGGGVGVVAVDLVASW